MRTKGMPFGYLEFSRAIGETMPASVTAPVARPAPGLGSRARAQAPACVRVPPAATFLNRTIRVWCHNGSLPDPLRYPRAALKRLEGTAAAVPVGTAATVQTRIVATVPGLFCPLMGSHEHYK